MTEQNNTSYYNNLEALRKNANVSDWLVDALESADARHDDERELDYVQRLGSDLLKAKIEDVELSNAALASRLRKRVPDSLDVFETAIALVYLKSWKNITFLQDDTDTAALLFVYQESGDNEGIYVSNEKYQDALVDRLSPRYLTKNIIEVKAKISRLIESVDHTYISRKRNLVAVKNGLYNKLTKELEPFNPELIFTCKTNVNYVIDPQNPVITADDGSTWDVDTWIKDLCEDDDTNQLMWETIKASFDPTIAAGKSIWWISEQGNNGKGTLGDLIRNIVGAGNYSSLNIPSYGKEFMLSALIGKGLNIADENPVNAYAESLEAYKAAITGDDILINRKYMNPVVYRSQGVDIQMMNGLTKTKDKSDSLLRRIVIVPFTKSFTNNGEKKYIKQDYVKRQDVLEYVQYKALNMDDFTEFTTPQKSVEMMNVFVEMNDPVVEFWNEMSTQFANEMVPVTFAYELFVAWFNRYNPHSKAPSLRAFNTAMANILRKDDAWEDEPRQAKTGKRMDNDEPLITEYNLVNWMAQRAGFLSAEANRKFKRKEKYKAFLKK